MIKIILHSTCNLCGEHAEFFDNGTYKAPKYQPFTTVTLRVNYTSEPSEQNNKTIQVCQDCYEKLQDLCEKIGTTTQSDDYALSLTFDDDEEVYYIPMTDVIGILSILYHLTPTQSEDSINEITFVENNLQAYHTTPPAYHE